MVTEAPSLYPEVAEATTPPGRGRHGYYRALARFDPKREGWIMTGGAWPQIKADFEFKGLQYLSQMPTFFMSYGDNERESNQVDLRGRKFFPHKEPWRSILQAPGGAELFPISQIIAYRWHIRLPYREVQWPQLKDVMVYDLFCPECDKGIFSSVIEQDAVEMLRIHLTSQTNDSHKYRPEDLLALGREYEIDFFAARRSRRVVRPSTPAAVEEPQLPEEPAAADLTLAAEDLVNRRTCPECGESVEIAKFQFARHVKAHKKVAAPVAG